MTVSNIIILILFSVLVAMIWVQIRKRRQEFSILILSSILIFTHMISGISWTAHFVTAMFWYLPLFLIDRKSFTLKSSWIFNIVLVVLVFFLAVEGSDTTGRTVYALIRRYDIFVFMPLVLFFYYAILYFRGERNYYKQINKEQLLS